MDFQGAPRDQTTVRLTGRWSMLRPCWPREQPDSCALKWRDRLLCSRSAALCCPNPGRGGPSPKPAPALLYGRQALRLAHGGRERCWTPGRCGRLYASRVRPLPRAVKPPPWLDHRLGCIMSRSRPHGPPRPVAAATQSNAVKVASVQGAKDALLALAASSAVILGACKLFPRFNRSLSVSAKTALIVSRCCPRRVVCCWGWWAQVGGCCLLVGPPGVHVHFNTQFSTTSCAATGRHSACRTESFQLVGGCLAGCHGLLHWRALAVRSLLCRPAPRCVAPNFMRLCLALLHSCPFRICWGWACRCHPRLGRFSCRRSSS